MARFVRLIVHQRVGGEPRRVGLFTAAYHLLEEDDLLPHDRETLVQLLAWFEAELTIPPRGTIPARAIFWYADIGPFSQRMWELAQLLENHDFSTELITTRFVGQVVYQDRHQV